jgi:hypothetical protein
MRELATSAKIDRFLRALGRSASSPSRVYLTGGVSAVLLGFRSSTVDIDLKMIPDSDELLRAIPKLKEELQLNVELAAPDQFIPPLPGWQERSPFLRQEGSLSVYHYDFYAQALAKIERGHARDLADVEAMTARGYVEPRRLEELFDAIVPRLERFPGIDAAAFRAKLRAYLERAR